MIFAQQYPEDNIKPERGGTHNWHVWDRTGTLHVLSLREYVEWLAANPDSAYTINFANASYTHIVAGDDLWNALLEVTKTHDVALFAFNMHGGYEPWDGSDLTPRTFDAIRLSIKGVGFPDLPPG